MAAAGTTPEAGRTMRQEHKYQAGVAHLQAGRSRPAEVCLRAVVAVNPRSAPAHYHLGLALRGERKLKAAAHAFRAAVALDPGLAHAEAALALTLQQLGQPEAAEPHARRAVAADPRPPVVHAVLGDILRDLGRLGEARAAFEAALRIAPDHVDARFGRAFLNLLEGDYAAGWVDYEFRKGRLELADPALGPPWRGEDLRGRTLLVHGEQGLGDSLQFLRYVPFLAERGVRVVALLPAALAELARSSIPAVRVLRPGEPIPPFDACCPLPSLPLFCGARLETIPGAAGYLSAPADRLATWRTRLGQSADLTVALSWAGNPDHPNDRNRSMALADLEPLLKIPGVRWLSLQKGPAAAELARRRDGGILDLGGDLADLADTAAVIRLADLTLSVDTAPCHLAGALGRPVWTLLPFAPDWRWLAKGRASPWYGAMRLYRKAAPGGWGAVTAEAARDLAALVAARR